jgi:glycosyltransferase involved in cell wall biosynthesis
MVILGMPELPAPVRANDGPVTHVHRVRGSGLAARIQAQQTLLPSVLRRLEPDVLFSADPSRPLRSIGCPFVPTVHDLRYLARPDEFNPARRQYRRLAWEFGMKRASRLVVNSEATAHQVVEFYPSLRDRIRPVRFGADHVDGWKSAADTPHRHAVTFGHWSNKRPDFAIRAWAELRRSLPSLDTTLEVVGVPPDGHAELRSVALQEGVDDLVQVHEFLADAEFQGLFASAAVVLMTSTLEGFGLPVIEAMQLGIPVVASRGVGMETAGGDAALYADPDSPADFARQIGRVLVGAPERAQIAAHGRDHASTFNWAGAAASVRAVLVEAIENRQRDG